MKTTRFLIASLHAAELEDCDTIASVERAIDSLPTELDKVYARTIERICRSKAERARIGLMALLWVTHAKRPLKLQELQLLLATDYTVGSFALGKFNAASRPAKNDILTSACGLLTVDSSDIVHLTRKWVFASEGSLLTIDSR